MPRRTVSLDKFDLAILNILQDNNLTPQRAIGESVGLSTPAVQRRIKRLQRDGVILRNVAILDPESVGLAITLFVEVEFISETSDLIDLAKREFKQSPHVQQCYYVTGDADFILVIVVPNMATYEQLTRELFFENKNVRRFRTFVTMDRVKTNMAVDLTAADQSIE